MIDYAGLYKEIMNADNRAFVRQIKELQKQELALKADCECNGGGFAYCENCHGE